MEESHDEVNCASTRVSVLCTKTFAPAGTVTGTAVAAVRSNVVCRQARGYCADSAGDGWCHGSFVRQGLRGRSCTIEGDRRCEPSEYRMDPDRGVPRVRH